MRTPDDVIDFANSFFGPRALLAAARVGLFAAIAAGPKTSAEVAAAIRCDARATDLLLHALVALGLCEKREAGATFAPSPLARECLVPGSPRDLTDYLKLDADTFESWSRFEEALRTGAPVEVSSRAANLGFADRHRDFILAMRATARGTAAVVAKRVRFDLILGREPRTLLDLGAGPATFAQAFAARWPQLRATALDLPEAVAIAREVLAEEPDRDAASRVDLRAGDFHRDDLGGPYDVAWVSHVIHGHPEATLAPLLARVAAALAPGGVLLVHDFVLHVERTSPLYPALFSLNMLVMSDGGRVYSAPEIRALLVGAGLDGVEQLHVGEPRGLDIMFGRKR